MTHDHAGHIDLNEALRNLRNIREWPIEQIRTNDIEYEGVKTKLIDGDRRFDEARQRGSMLTEAL